MQSIPGSTVSFAMVAVPGGVIKVGSPPEERGRDSNDLALVEVQIKPFWLGKFEVTWQEYLPYVQFNPADIVKYHPNSRVPIDRDGITHPSQFYGSFFRGRGERGYPAIGMGRIAASEYCRWLSGKTGRRYRLPTEAEWEYACRAGTNSAYFWGDDVDQAKEYAWFQGNSAYADQSETTHPVGKLKPNRFGLYDMAGNVAEWCAKPTADASNVARGGAFSEPATSLRCAARLIETPDWDALDPEFPRSPWWLTADFVGFRVALDAGID